MGMDRITVKRRKAWADALMGGEYAQGKGGLRRGDLFCCLGVACDLYAKDTGDGKWDKQDQHTRVSEFRSKDCEYDHEGDTYAPPATVRAYYGLSEDEMQELITANDVTGLNFTEIAQLILFPIQK